MKVFECQRCGQPLYFDNIQCESCRRRLGYLPEKETITALEPEGEHWRALAAGRRRFRFCTNAVHDVCNWLLPLESADSFCAACRHNRTIPDLSVADNLVHWRQIEQAKHRLFYTLLKLDLPLATKVEDPDNGLAFDFLAPDGNGAGSVVTGHTGGLITINLAEADDAERERQRRQLNEPYRTLLGHFRHEIAHYYWDRLVAPTPHVEEFRAVFGDERADYGAALQSYYDNGPPSDWSERYVTAYASAHPWEDFAETWAHYLHMVDTLETAGSFGMSIEPRLSKGNALATQIDFDSHNAPLAKLVSAWLPLTFAVNSVNRSMGLPDLYPFVLAPPAIVKLTFVHDRIHEHRRSRPARTGALRAIIAALRAGSGRPAR